MNRRDYTELALLSPQVTKSPNGGLSFAGQHDRYNSIQIDGTNNNDPFGSCQSGNGTPGWAVGLTAFTPEAVKELQVVSAPFDVRYGSFAGGLINAVTQSGSNRVEGSILGYLESSDLVGTDVTGSRGSDFSRKELGLTLGAPIVRDRVALFVNADVAAGRSSPSPCPLRAATRRAERTRPGWESAMRAWCASRTSCGATASSRGASRPGRSAHPTRNLFVKVTAQLGVGSRLAVSHNYGHGNVRDGTLGRDSRVLSSLLERHRESRDHQCHQARLDRGLR